MQRFVPSLEFYQEKENSSEHGNLSIGLGIAIGIFTQNINCIVLNI